MNRNIHVALFIRMVIAESENMKFESNFFLLTIYLGSQ
jgi:hypothetical protein